MNYLDSKFDVGERFGFACGCQSVWKPFAVFDLVGTEYFN